MYVYTLKVNGMLEAINSSYNLLAATKLVVLTVRTV
jgi:hypothetical protein